MGRAKAVADIGERLDLLFDEAQPHDANRRLVKHLRHERAALFSFLTTERGAVAQGRLMTFLRTAQQQGADAIAMLVDLARAPSPGVVAGLTLRSG